MNNEVSTLAELQEKRGNLKKIAVFFHLSCRFYAFFHKDVISLQH